MRAVGLMSGTSLDGIDAALVEIAPKPHGYAIELVRFVTEPFAGEVRDRLWSALPPNRAGAADVAEIDGLLGAELARVAARVAGATAIDYVASHGLTLFHRGEDSVTLQVGDPYRIRDAMSASVVFDFRRADCALGGHGAPLVPYFDGLAFGTPDVDVVALNLGGIANVTVLPRGCAAADARAWDCGPANMLVDGFVKIRTNGAEAFDRDGAHAARGAVDGSVLEQLVTRDRAYLRLAPPKSTGRERYGTVFLDAHADLLAPLSLEAGCATLCAFAADAIARDVADFAPAGSRVVASGGGTHNATLMAMLRERLVRTGSTLVTSDRYGVDPDAKEAIAFAVLGYETLRGRPASLPGATGASRAAVLGAIAPFALERLLAKIRAEGTANEAG